VKLVLCVCRHCNRSFSIEGFRLKEAGRGSFCSRECYQFHPRTEKHKSAISNGMRRAHARRRP
jgi:hypothetical protein